PGRIMADESHGTMNILLDLADDEFRLRAVDNRENSVPMLQHRLEELWIDSFVTRKPTAADHEDDAESVGFCWRKNVKRERGAKFAAIDNIFDPLKFQIRLGEGAGQNQREQAGRNKFFHAFDFNELP